MTTAPTTYKCDRDGTEARGGPNPMQPPDGWAVLNVGMNFMTPQVVHLCPSCKDKFVTFIGGSFKLEPMFPPPLRTS